MYLRPAFDETDLTQLDALSAHDPFITLVTVDADGIPDINHVPVLYSRDGETILLEGHWARPNPQAGHAGEALAIVHGPHAYVSPSVYPDKESAARVPTWNYAVAHLHGRLEPFDDTAALADLVQRMSVHFETLVGRDWRFEPEREDHARQLRGIIGFRLRVTRPVLKFKLSQNHPAQNIKAVANDLAARDDADARAVATLMRATLPDTAT
jgi:transcriptional regulator